MAVTQIHPIKSTLKKAIAYICNADKTDNKLLISGFHCTPEMAAYEFEFTKIAADRCGGVLAHHLIQSFSPGEVTHEMAHEIGKRLADELLQGRYEYVLTTHINRSHIHNHIIFNSVPIDLKTKYRSNSKSYFAIRKLSDDLCEEYNLSVVVPNNEKAKTCREHYAEKDGISWKAALREAIDRCIKKARDWEEFLALMEAEKYEIKQNKYTSFRAVGQKRFTRAKTLGERYTEKNIKSQLYGEVKTAHVPMPAKVTLLIDIENSVKAKQSAGLKEWMEMKNLKMAAMTMNYLSDNNLWYYKDLSGKHDELKNRRDSSLKQIKQIEKRIKELNAQIKDLDTFRKNKPVVEKLDSVVFKEKYKRENETAFILFNAAKQSLNAHFPNKKYPLIKTLRAELSELYAEKQKLYPEYYEAKDEYKSISTYKQNLETITNRTPQEIEREERMRNKSKNELE